MSTGTGMAECISREPEIPRTLDDLLSTLEHLTEVTNALFSRIEPILAPTPLECDEKEPDTPARTKVGGSIIRGIEISSRLINNVNAVIERVEV